MFLLSITLATMFSNVIYNYYGSFFLPPVKSCFVEIWGFERIATIHTFLEYGRDKRRGHTSIWVIYIELTKDYPMQSTPSPFVPTILKQGVAFITQKLVGTCPNFESTSHKLDSKRNLPLLSTATHKKSLHRFKKNFVHRYPAIPLTNHIPKASDYLYNKGEIDLHSNLVTGSKVTVCNRMSLTLFTQKSMS